MKPSKKRRKADREKKRIDATERAKPDAFARLDAAILARYTRELHLTK